MPKWIYPRLYIFLIFTGKTTTDTMLKNFKNVIVHNYYILILLIVNRGFLKNYHIKIKNNIDKNTKK